MNLFFSPGIDSDFHILDEKETFHCTKVLRLKQNDIMHITDGVGNLYKAEIVEIHKKQTILKILGVSKNYNKRNYYLHVAIAPTKNIERFEFFLEKATEIGIDEITPIICKNSERKTVKLDRLNRIIEAAMKQSFKAYHPKINCQIDYEKFIVEDHAEKIKLIAHCNEKEERDFAAKLIEKDKSVLVLIGPEGDFTNSEIEYSIKQGFVGVSLGNSRLRTETAGIVACDTVSFVNQYLNCVSS